MLSSEPLEESGLNMLVEQACHLIRFHGTRGYVQRTYSIIRAFSSLQRNVFVRLSLGGEFKIGGMGFK